MPTLAIFNDELRSLWSSWLVRGWLIVTALFTLLFVAGAWEQADPASLIASLLFSYLVFPWFLVVIMLGISSATSSRLDALSDGILCRPVTRYEYLVASWAARVVAVLSVYLVVMLPTMVVVTFAKRTAVDPPVTIYGALASLAVVALVLTFLVTLSFLAATALRKPLLAALVLVFIWFPVNMVLHVFALEEFSPISLSQALPTLLRTPWHEPEAEAAAKLTDKDMEALARQAGQFMSILSGGTPQPVREENFFERGDYEDFSLVKVSLGYGIPTLLALVLSAAFFCWRDL